MTAQQVEVKHPIAGYFDNLISSVSSELLGLSNLVAKLMTKRENPAGGSVQADFFFFFFVILF